jgi:hypothetical protein
VFVRRWPFISLLLMGHVALAGSAGTTMPGLFLTYARDNRVCANAAELLQADKSCRVGDNESMACGRADMRTLLANATPIPIIGENLAENEYGYSEVAVPTSAKATALGIIYVSRFRGDHFPRLLEAWRVNRERLAEVLKIPPGPGLWDKPFPGHAMETNADEFAAVLAAGVKVADQWSPIIEIFDESYAVVRECSGRVVYGGDYACNKVIRITVLRLDAASQKSVPYCEFSAKRPK